MSRGYQIKLIAVNTMGNEDVSYDPVGEIEFEGEQTAKGFIDACELADPNDGMSQWWYEWALYVRCETGEATHIKDFGERTDCLEMYRLLSGAPDDYEVPVDANVELPHYHAQEVA